MPSGAGVYDNYTLSVISYPLTWTHVPSTLFIKSHQIKSEASKVFTWRGYLNPIVELVVVTDLIMKQLCDSEVAVVHLDRIESQSRTFNYLF